VAYGLRQPVYDDDDDDDDDDSYLRLEGIVLRHSVCLLPMSSRRL
jgi:hypothetical protein